MSPRRVSAPPPASVPLQHRVPNGPPAFVGRDREVHALGKRAESSALVIVTGPGGVGKTSLVVHTMRAILGDRIDDALYFAVQPEEPIEQVRHRLFHALARATDGTASKQTVDNEPESVVAAAIDLAEASSRWVLLDDVHHTETSEMEQLLVQLASYARKSRWLVTSRAAPKLPALLSHHVELSKMSDSELAELARTLVPDAASDALRRAVRAASGSPWLLQQWAAVGERGLSVSREELLASMDHDSSDLLQALAVLHGSFTAHVLATFMEVPDEARLEALERRGLVQRRGDGIAVHDVVRGLLFPGKKHGGEMRAWMARAADGFARSTDDDALVEAMRLLLLLGKTEDVRELLSTHGDRLLARGHAPGLWQIVAHLADPTIKRFRMRCAAELGNPTAIAEVEVPFEPDAGERLAWAHTLYAQGDLSAASLEAFEAARQAAGMGDVRTTIEGALLAARCQSSYGTPERAETTLAALEPPPGSLALRVAAARALASAVRGDAELADAALMQLRSAPPGDDADEAAHDLAEAFYVLGRSDTADELLDRVLATRRGGRASLLRARQAMATRARLLIDRGELAEATALVKSMRPFARPPSVLRPEILELEAAIDLIEGRAEGLLERIEAVVSGSEGVDAGCALRARCMSIDLALASGVTPTLSVPVQTSRLEAHELALWRRLANAHAGNFVVGDELDPIHPRHRALAALVGSTDALVARRPADAAEIARTGARLAKRHRYLVLEGVLLRAEGDALAVLGAAGELEANSAFLRELANTVKSPRLALDAELWLAVDEPAELERIADAFDVSPSAARRARALLGADERLDEVDGLVVRALVSRRGGAVAETVCGGGRAWTVGWGLDDRTQTVWLSEGRKVDLSKKPLLWRVLATLADRGGQATKEDLVLTAWQEREYHPGRHDSRLHVSARKIRELIEDEPAAPRRLLTTDDGYRLGGTVRRLRA